METIIVLVSFCWFAYVYCANTKMCAPVPLLEEVCDKNYNKNTDLNSNSWILSSIKEQTYIMQKPVVQEIPNAVNRTFNVSLDCNKSSSAYGTFVLSWHISFENAKELPIKDDFLFFNVNQNDIVLIAYEKNGSNHSLEKPKLVIQNVSKMIATLIFHDKNVWAIEYCSPYYGMGPVTFLFTTNRSYLEPINIYKNPNNYLPDSDDFAKDFQLNPDNITSFDEILRVARTGGNYGRPHKLSHSELIKRQIVFGAIIVLSSLIMVVLFLKIYRYNQVAPG